MAKKSNCYLYTRVSTEMQLDGYSLEAQLDRLRREAKHRGMKVVGEYSDEGKSGKNIKGRPAFQRMLNDIRTEKDDVDYVLVFKLSRFGRNAADTLNSLQYMEDFGVHLLCVEDGIDSAGASGKLMISVLASVAEIERENIKEQTMLGRQQKARDGRWNGGFAPYGYKLEYRDGEKSKVLVIDEKEAELVRLIYDKFINGNMGANGIARWLNEHGYTKTVRQNGTIPTISAHFVKLVLDNPVYMGKIAYGRRKTEKIDGTRNEFHVVKQPSDTYEIYDGIHEAIISEEMWYKVQAKRQTTGVKREKTHSLGHAHILSGLLRCPVCGSPMYGVVNRKKKKGTDEYYTDMWYYRCKHRSGVTGKSCTYKTYVRQDEVNNEVFAMTKYVLFDKDFRQRVAKKAGNCDGEELKELIADRNRLQEKRDKAENKKKKLLVKIENLDIDDDLYDSLYNDLLGVVRNLTEEIARIDADILRSNISIENAENEKFSSEQFLEMLDVMINNMETMEDEQVKRLMQLIFEEIHIFPERQEDGRWVEYARFKVALNLDKDIFETVTNEKGEKITGVSLPYDKHDECVVLMSRVTK